MAVLLDLPDETLLEIIPLTARERCVGEWNFPSGRRHSPQVDFARLSLVNHRFYRLTQPSLCRSIQIVGYWEQNYQTSLRLFLRLLLARPALGAHVRELTVDWHDEVYDKCAPEQGESDDEEDNEDMVEEVETEGADGEVGHSLSADNALFASAASARGLSNRIQRALKGGSETAQTVLLLDLLPHLHSLSITPPLYSDLFFVDAVSKGNLPQGLRSLQEIELSWYDTEGGFDLLTIEQCLLLPAFRKLTVGAVDEDPWDSNEEAHVSAPPGSSSVTELVFILGAIECTALARTLRLPRALSRFAYDLGSCTTGSASFDAAALWTGLHAHTRDSLTHLEITTEYDDHDHDPDEPRGVLGPLRDFVKLSSVDLPISLLLGSPSHVPTAVKLADVLPPALVSLKLRIDDDWTLEACVDTLVEVLEAKAVHGQHHSPGQVQSPAPDRCWRATGPLLLAIARGRPFHHAQKYSTYGIYVGEVRVHMNAWDLGRGEVLSGHLHILAGLCASPEVTELEGRGRVYQGVAGRYVAVTDAVRVLVSCRHKLRVPLGELAVRS